MRPYVGRSQGSCIPMSEVICSWTGSPGWLFYFYTGPSSAMDPWTFVKVGASSLSPCLSSAQWVYTGVYGCPRTRERPGWSRQVFSRLHRQTAWCRYSKSIPLLGHGHRAALRPFQPPGSPLCSLFPAGSYMKSYTKSA